MDTAHIRSVRPVRMAIATGVVLIAALGGCTSDTGGAAVPTPSSTAGTSLTPAPSTSASSAPPTTRPSTPAPTAVPTGRVSVPVYFVGSDPQRVPRLYREFHRVSATGGRVVAALREMLRGRPADPDYMSLWPSDTTVLSVVVAGDAARVDLSRFVALGAALEDAAVQQLVHTVTAANPQVKAVRLRVNGSAPVSGHTDYSGRLTRKPALDILANVWILAPTQGATVGSPVTIRVYGTGFEGNVPLRVYRGETLVVETFVTTSMGSFSEASTTVRLDAGTYRVQAFNDSPEDGSLTLWDSKDFSVS